MLKFLVLLLFYFKYSGKLDRMMNYIAKTKEWIESFVIQYNLCPFARKPFIQNVIRYEVYEGEDWEDLGEAISLRDHDPPNGRTSGSDPESPPPHVMERGAPCIMKTRVGGFGSTDSHGI